MSEALQTLFSLNGMILLLAGTSVGLVVGVLPGLGSAFAMAILLPFTFNMDLLSTLVLLMGAYTATLTGGAITSVLIGVPGMGASIVTTFDGYPMCKQGRAGEAIGIAAIAGFVGNASCDILMLLVAPIYLLFVLRFGAQELFVIGIWALAITVLVAPGRSLAKNIVAGFIGVAISCIGMDLLQGSSRMTFGSSYLLEGVPLIPAIIGIFAVYEILQDLLKEKDLTISIPQKAPKLSGFAHFRKAWNWVILAIGSIIGFIVGIIPGTGSLQSIFLTWGILKKVSPRAKEYGTGCPETILGAESSNHATHPGAILTTLILGVPGASEMVILLAAFTLHGMRCGPLLLVNNPSILSEVFLTLMVGGCLTLGLVWGTLRGWAKAIEIPKCFLWPITFFLCVIGTYWISASMDQVLVMLAVGVLAWILEKGGFSRIALLMGMIMGPIMESNLRLALWMAPPQAFFKPTVILLLVITIATIVIFTGVLKPKKITAELNK